MCRGLQYKPQKRACHVSRLVFLKVFELARGEEEWTEYDSPSAICALSIHFTPHRTLIRNSLHLLPEALTVTAALSQVSNCDY
jgi:hypothetical protein